MSSDAAARLRLEPLLEPVVRVGLVVEGRDFPVATPPVEGLGLVQRLVGLEAERREAELAGLVFERLENAARDAEPAGRIGRPHALDLADAAAFDLERAAADRLAVEAGDEKVSGGRG